MEKYYLKIFHKLNKPLFSNIIVQNNHLIFIKYSQQRYYKYIFELLELLAKKSSFKNKNKIFHTSLYYLLIILYNCGNTPYCSNLDLMILSCFFLGIKTIEEQKNMITITKLKKIYPEKYLSYENSEIKTCEMICIYFLKYNINFITIYDCICYLLKDEDDNILKSLIFEELESKMLNEGVQYYIYKNPMELSQEFIILEKQKYIKTHSSLILNKSPKFNNINHNDYKAFLNFGNEESLSTSASFGSGQNRNNIISVMTDFKVNNNKNCFAVKNDIQNNLSNFCRNKTQANLIKLTNNQKKNLFFISKSKILNNNDNNNYYHNERYSINKNPISKSTFLLDNKKIISSKSINSFTNTYYNQINNNRELNNKENQTSKKIFKKPLIKTKTSQTKLMNYTNELNLYGNNIHSYDNDNTKFYTSNKKNSKNHFFNLYRNYNDNAINKNMVKEIFDVKYNGNSCKYKDLKRIKGKSILQRNEKNQ